MFGTEAEPEALQPVYFPRFDLVRTAHVMAQLEEERRDPAHSTSGHADEVNPMALPRQHFLKIEFRGERQDSPEYTFPSFRPRARPRFPAGAAPNPPPAAATGL